MYGKAAQSTNTIPSATTSSMMQLLLSILLLLTLPGQPCCWAFTTTIGTSTAQGGSRIAQQLLLATTTTTTTSSTARQQQQVLKNKCNSHFHYALIAGGGSSRLPTLLCAGGFEWEDPTEALDQGVENPYKNEELMNAGEDGMKIDPARLLGPRLNGSNLYLIGMMGSGKSSVGDKVARRT
jgi:hypothetical protein